MSLKNNSEGLCNYYCLRSFPLKKKTVVVVGPTASGKTALGIHICKKFNGEVISADSMQIYKGMSISTAKPSIEEQQGVPHHLIDFLDLNSLTLLLIHIIRLNSFQ